MNNEMQVILNNEKLADSYFADKTEFNSRLAKACSEAGKIPKRGKFNGGGIKYDYVTHEDVMLYCPKLLSEQGISVVPREESVKISTFQTAKGSMRFEFVSEIEYAISYGMYTTHAKMIGVAHDNAPQGAQKSKTAAQKYMYLQLLQISTGDPRDDLDYSRPDVEEEPQVTAEAMEVGKLLSELGISSEDEGFIKILDFNNAVSGGSYTATGSQHADVLQAIRNYAKSKQKAEEPKEEVEETEDWRAAMIAKADSLFKERSLNIKSPKKELNRLLKNLGLSMPTNDLEFEEASEALRAELDGENDTLFDTLMNNDFIVVGTAGGRIVKITKVASSKDAAGHQGVIIAGEGYGGETVVGRDEFEEMATIKRLLEIAEYEGDIASNMEMDHPVTQATIDWLAGQFELMDDEDEAEDEAQDGEVQVEDDPLGDTFDFSDIFN